MNNDTAADNDRLIREFLLAWERRDTVSVVEACTEDSV